MSIIIRNIEMPKSCGTCFFNRQTRSGWKCSVAYPERWKDFENPSTRPDWCPLIPILPHGRLIDADALIREHRADNFDFAIYATYLVQNAPTVLEAEEE